MKYKVIIEVTVILASGLVAFEWLHGEILYFWDEWFPFKPPADIYYFSFAWQQLIGNGVPWTPNCRGLFFPSIYLLHNVLSLSLQASQLTLLYALFTCSGLSMYWLVAYLRRTYQLGKGLDFAPISAALVYMFNYYTAYFLLSQLWPSWFLYSLLPLSILVFLDGMKRSESDSIPILNVLALAILFQLMSAGFWQAPYLAYTLFLFFAFFIIYVRGNAVGKKQLKNLAKFLAASSLAVIATGLWWLNFFIVSTTQSLALFTPGTLTQSIQPWMLGNLREVFTGSGTLPFGLVNLIRIYPPLFNIPGNVYTWQTAYSGSSPNLLLVLASLVFTFTVFVPLLLLRQAKLQTRALYAVMYSSIVLLLFFGAQGSNPLARLLFQALDEAKFPFLGVFYISQAQFLMFPLIFFYAIGFGEGVACLQNWAARLPKLHKRTRSPQVRHTPQLVAVVLILIISVGIYPWYLWTPQATQVYVSGSQTVSSTTSFPSYLKELTDYLTANAADSVTYIIPQTGNGLLGMKFNDSEFVDTFDPIRMMAGKPTLVGISEPNPQNALYWEMQNIVYEGVPPVNSFSNLLTAMNVKYILVETNALVYSPSMNLSMALDFLSNQNNIKLVRQFGPLLLYENLEQTQMIYAANITKFNPYIQPELSLYMSSTVFHPDSEVLVSNSTLTPIRNFSRPVITYSEINPTLYKIQVKNATSPYALVFTQNFDKEWQASIDGVPIDSLYHFVANGYANAWYITRKGDYTVTLSYLPQESYDRLVVISGFSLAVLVFISVFEVARKVLSYRRETKIPRNLT
jgi:hypothetical protein